MEGRKEQKNHISGYRKPIEVGVGQRKVQKGERAGVSAIGNGPSEDLLLSHVNVLAEKKTVNSESRDIPTVRPQVY